MRAQDRLLLKQAEESEVALGISSLNGGAIFLTFAVFTVQDPNVILMILLGITVPIIIWLVLAKYFASQADELASS